MGNRRGFKIPEVDTLLDQSLSVDVGEIGVIIPNI